MAERQNNRPEFDVGNLVLRLDTTIRARVENIDRVVERVLTLASETGCVEDKELAIETALREALANAILHGCRGDARKRVRVCVACDQAHGMIIVVRDPGPGFDPSAIPSPVDGEQLYASHGRGIYLIDQLMDEVEFRKGGTEIWMRKS